MSGPWEGRRLHFVGVAGAGMSGYARAAHALGASVSGSDRASSPYSERLQVDGVLQARIGHDPSNLPAVEGLELIYSSAIPPTNPERLAARERGVPQRPRAELLAELTALKRTVAVAGTHGKTTTSSMLVYCLSGAGLDPSWLIGGAIGPSAPNAHWSAGQWLVVEADESDRSMLSLQAEIVLLTNVELDHHAAYRSLAEVRGAFAELLGRASSAIVLWDRPDLLALIPGTTQATVVPYDLAELELTSGGSRFGWEGLEVKLKVPGAHNALNATGALEVARLIGAPAQGSIEGLARFGGATRRFERMGRTPAGTLVVDDYAHHPTEIAATLAAARTLGPRRLVAVFQPHLYSRTALLARELGAALALADVVVVLGIYAARERPEDHPGVSGRMVAQAAADAAWGGPVYWLPTIEDAEPVLEAMLGPEDLCLLMGAGDINSLGARLLGLGP